jgi:pyruvate/2-oxoglutarate/acetoin dehydrogenase E1 component
LPYAVGAARSIVLDKHLGTGEAEDRIAIVFVGEGGAQNGRMAECLNAAAKENLPILFLVIDNGRAINTFTKDVAQNQEVFNQGKHYGIPGVLADGQNVQDTLRIGRAAINHVRTKGPAILQVHTFRFNGHSPADPEHERNRKDEKRWARAACDPIKIFEESSDAARVDVEGCTKRAKEEVRKALEFANASPPPPPTLAAELEYPDPTGTVDYSKREPEMGVAKAEEVTKATVPAETLTALKGRIDALRAMASAPTGISIGDAVNLAILEEMVRDPTCVAHAEDLQAGSSYNIPANTQQAFGTLRAADEIIDEGHFIGKALGEAMNGYRPIVELMNANFGIYGMAELSSAGNTYATTGGQFNMPMTVIGAGGTAPNQSLGAEHSQPFHAYIMGIPGLKICSASKPQEAYGLAKSMIRDNGPGVLLLPVKLMKTRGPLTVDNFLPLHKATLQHEASDDAIARGKAVTVLTYLHGTKESEDAIEILKTEGYDVDLIELTCLKPFDKETVETSLKRTHKLAILDESTRSGGVGATMSALVAETLFDELDAPVLRLCMEDAPVPYATEMEKEMVKRASDLVAGVKSMC